MDQSCFFLYKITCTFVKYCNSIETADVAAVAV